MSRTIFLKDKIEIETVSEGDIIEVDKVEIKTAHFDKFLYGNDLMPDDPRFSRYYKGKDNLFYLKNKLYNIKR